MVDSEGIRSQSTTPTLDGESYDDSNLAAHSTAVASHLSMSTCPQPSGSRKRQLEDGDGENTVMQDERMDNTHGGSATSVSATAKSVASAAPPELDPPPNKKARLEIGKTDSDKNSSIQPISPVSSIPSPFLALPLELLSEVLILTGSSRHVLAIARTCKALCHTLLGPDAQFIWREARRGTGCAFEVDDKTPVVGVVNWLANPVGPMPHVVAGFVVNINNNDDTEPQQWPKKLIAPPDLPKQFFTEASYAAFLFDSGPCNICGDETDVQFDSFALRIRKCKKPSCQRPPTITALNPADPIHQQLRPIITVNECITFGSGFGTPYSVSDYWPYAPYFHNIYCLSSELEAARSEYAGKLEDEAYKEKFARVRKRNDEWMKFCVDVCKWKRRLDARRQDVKKLNEQSSKKFANKFGWDHDDLLGVTVFGPYQKHKTKMLELITEADVKIMHDQIEAQLLDVAGKRERRAIEISLMDNRKDVEQLYNRLSSAKKAYPILPSLPNFRKLPVVDLLQSAEHAERAKPTVATTLQNNATMKELLDKQIKQWVDNARKDLAAVLGFPKNWKTANKNVLHPVERVTGRFLCVKCERVEEKYKMDGCFDFTGACRHVCFVGSEKKGRLRTGQKALWDPSNFVKDEKAIKVLRQSLQALGYAEDRDVGNYLLQVGFATLCTSCDPPMVIDSRSLVGHSHRHENMQVSFLTSLDTIESYLGGFPYEYGLVSELTQRSASFANSIKRQIEKKNFGCRHCLRKNRESSMTISESVPEVLQGVGGSSRYIELSAVAHRMLDLQIEGPRERPPPLYNFNGMRSHLKAKHAIADIRDEDVLCYEAVLPITSQ